MANCKNCIIIRYFLVSVLILILTALIFTEKLKYLSFINPLIFSYLVILSGVLIFISKTISYYMNRSSISNKSNKIRNVSRKSSKSVSSKKIN